MNECPTIGICDHVCKRQTSAVAMLRADQSTADVTLATTNKGGKRPEVNEQEGGDHNAIQAAIDRRGKSLIFCR
jgi:hypothetical protein